MTGGDMTTWDKIYALGGYDEEPDEELIQLSQKIPKGRALDVGAGEGRHTLWLASQGFIVDAVDFHLSFIISHSSVTRFAKWKGFGAS
jgi:2-polyprenyl-3-methyl-5-hydroxy-6-metoxy-1,4-benzoquinol methylase